MTTTLNDLYLITESGYRRGRIESSARNAALARRARAANRRAERSRRRRNPLVAALHAR